MTLITTTNRRLLALITTALLVLSGMVLAPEATAAASVAQSSAAPASKAKDKTKRKAKAKRKANKPSKESPTYQYPLRTKKGKRPHITSKYGMRTHPVYKVRRKHHGTDYRARCGTALYSASEGTVTRARYDRTGYGWWVEVRSKTKTGRDLHFRYAHMKSKPKVKEGKRVKTGTRIGSVGTTGTSTGCHLHFEIRRDGRDRKHTINPAKWLKRVSAVVVKARRS